MIAQTQKLVSKIYEETTQLINEPSLNELLKTSVDRIEVKDIIAKSLAKKPLSVQETAKLVSVKDPTLRNEVKAGAKLLKEKIYGNRIVLFAPLYIGNQCVNNCSYCGFRHSNKDMVRKTLTEQELKEEVKALLDQGHKRLILVYGEHPQYQAKFIAETVQVTYSVHSGNGEIRRVNINAAPLTVEGFRTVKAAGIGTYQIFQETYSPTAYKNWHPANTLKGDFLWRLDAFNRAFEGGIDDVGMGALFGLHDWRFEVLGLVSHALHLQKHYNCGPHTISFPRLKLASGGVQKNIASAVSDEDFKYLIAVLRLAVPYTGLILTAREPVEIRKEAIELGVSQIDAGTCIELGGYHKKESECQCLEKEQFEIGDERSLDEVLGELINTGYVPSFCTACYRKGRTGEHFMEFAIPGFIKSFCTPNAILTLAEYLEDYGQEKTKVSGNALIEKLMNEIQDNALKTQLKEKLRRIREEKKRDLLF